MERVCECCRVSKHDFDRLPGRAPSRGGGPREGRSRSA
jgi:hypothetical protein